MDLDNVESALFQVFMIKRLESTFPQSSGSFTILYRMGLIGMPPRQFLKSHSTFIDHVIVMLLVKGGMEGWRDEESGCRRIRESVGVKEGKRS